MPEVVSDVVSRFSSEMDLRGCQAQQNLANGVSHWPGLSSDLMCWLSQQLPYMELRLPDPSTVSDAAIMCPIHLYNCAIKGLLWQRGLSFLCWHHCSTEILLIACSMEPPGCAPDGSLAPGLTH